MNVIDTNYYAEERAEFLRDLAELQKDPEEQINNALWRKIRNNALKIFDRDFFHFDKKNLTEEVKAKFRARCKAAREIVEQLGNEEDRKGEEASRKRTIPEIVKDLQSKAFLTKHDTDEILSNCANYLIFQDQYQKGISIASTTRKEDLSFFERLLNNALLDRDKDETLILNNIATIIKEAPSNMHGKLIGEKLWYSAGGDTSKQIRLLQGVLNEETLDPTKIFEDAFVEKFKDSYLDFLEENLGMTFSYGDEAMNNSELESKKKAKEVALSKSRPIVQLFVYNGEQIPKQGPLTIIRNYMIPTRKEIVAHCYSLSLSG